MPPDSVFRATIKKKPSGSSPNKTSNLVKIATLGILGFGVIIANALLPITAGENSRRDTINVLGGIETSANCTSTGCIQAIVGITESMDLYNLSGSFVIGEPASPICELSSTGALQGKSCVITSGVQILGTIAGTLTQTSADARYVNTAGDTMTGALRVLVTGGNPATIGINSQNTISGAILYGYRGRFGVSLASSGTLVWTGRGSGNTLHIVKSISASGSLTVVGSPRIQRIISIPLCDAVTACATGSGVIFRIPKMLDNYAFSGATLDAGVTGTTGTMTVQVINITDATNLFTTKISLDSAEVSSDTAATPYVRNATLGQRTVTDGDRVMPRIDAVHTTPAKGVTINLHFIPL